MKMLRRSLRKIGFSLFLLFLVPLNVHAATAQFAAFDLWPAMGDRSFFNVDSSQGLYKFQYDFQVDNTFAYHPLQVIDPTGTTTRSAVDYYFADFITAAAGITNNWQFGVTLPIFSTIRFQSPTLASPPPAVNLFKVGDLRIASKIRFVDSYKHRFGAGLEPFVTVPLGADVNYMGNTGITGGFRAIGDVWLSKRIKMAMNLGAEFRQDQVVVSNIEFRNRFLASMGLSAKLGKGVTFSAEGQANTAFSHFYTQKETTPVEFLGGFQWEVGKTGLKLGVGGGTCAICGVMGAKARGFINIAYRRQNDNYREMDRKENETLAALIGQTKTKNQMLTEEIVYLRENCPSNPKEYDRRIHDKDCPKYFRLKDQVVTLDQVNDADFATVALALELNCPNNPGDYDPKKHAASCPKYYDLKKQMGSLGKQKSMNLKSGALGAGAAGSATATGAAMGGDSFAVVVLAMEKNCPKNQANYNPKTGDPACPKYYDLKKQMSGLSTQEDKELYTALQELKLGSLSGVSVSQNEIRTNAPIHFGFNQVDINKESAEILTYVAEAMEKDPSIKQVQIVGYTDAIGTPAANARVSLLRATRVVQYLQNVGLPERVKLIPVGKGSENPTAPNTTYQGRQQNRRVMFIRVEKSSSESQPSGQKSKPSKSPKK
jgi:outer membrane protein OmpA-like peptidoglycan-associated protein